MITQPAPSRARQIGQWIVFAVVVLAVVGVVLFGLYVYRLYNPCACSPSPPPTSTPTAWLIPFVG